MNNTLIQEDLNYYFPFKEGLNSDDERVILVNRIISLLLKRHEYNYNKALEEWGYNTREGLIFDLEPCIRNYYQFVNTDVPFDALSRIVHYSDKDIEEEWSANFTTKKQVIDHILEACKLYYGDKIIFTTIQNY